MNETYILVTLTFERTRPAHHVWRKASHDFNRYVQRLRRFHHLDIQVLRSIESHQDGYPHCHAVLRIPITIAVNNGRYFDKKLYAKWKSLWPSGFSDYRYAKNGRRSVLYVIKYATKNYRGVLAKKWNVVSVDSPLLPPNSSSLPNLVSTLFVHHVPVIIKESSTTKACKIYSIRQTTWSRNFFKKDINSVIQLDLIKPAMITHANSLL